MLLKLVPTTRILLAQNTRIRWLGCHFFVINVCLKASFWHPLITRSCRSGGARVAYSYFASQNIRIRWLGCRLFAINVYLRASNVAKARADYSYFVGTKYSYPMARLSLLRNQCLPKSKLLASTDYSKLSALAANKIDKGIKLERKGEDL